MRRGPPAEILAELRFARSLASRLAGPGGQYVGPLPGPPPEGEGVGVLLRLPPFGSLRFALPCLLGFLLRFYSIKSIHAFARGKYRAARALRPSRAVTWVQ